MEMDKPTRHPSAVATATAYLGVAKAGDAVGWGVAQEFRTPDNSEIRTRRFSGILLGATANRAWLVAAAESLERAEGSTQYMLICPARYVTNNIRLNLRVWEANGWVKYNGEPVVNRDVWERVLVPCKATLVRAHEPSTEAELALCEEAKTLAQDAVAAHLRHEE